MSWFHARDLALRLDRGFSPFIAALSQNRLRPLLCFESRQWAIVFAARDFAEHKAEAHPIIEASDIIHSRPAMPVAKFLLSDATPVSEMATTPPFAFYSYVAQDGLR
jgi:hypothetical protein